MVANFSIGLSKLFCVNYFFFLCLCNKTQSRLDFSKLSSPRPGHWFIEAAWMSGGILAVGRFVSIFTCCKLCEQAADLKCSALRIHLYGSSFFARLLCDIACSPSSFIFLSGCQLATPLFGLSKLFCVLFFLIFSNFSHVVGFSLGIGQ